MTTRNHNRAGFTLIELLVVMTLILVLAGLGVAFLPTIGDSARQAQGATMLQQWILQAKQKALRDQVPCGLRLVPYNDPATGVSPIYIDKSGRRYPAPQVRECQFIEQPDDFPSSVPNTLTGGTISVAPPVGNAAPTATIHMTLNGQVFAGDYLEIQGNGLMHKIRGVSPGPPGPPTTVLTLWSGFPYAVNKTLQYRIVRAPRVTGDDILQFPDPVMIDLATTNLYSGYWGGGLPTPNLDGSIDILFAPSGAVISSGVNGDTINLWVRDFVVDKPVADRSDGQQTIIAIYVRSGLTAAHPPSPGVDPVLGKAGTDPYAFIKDGKSSGK